MTEPIQVYPGIYLCKIPLPNNPLRELNSYFIPDEKGSLIVDTGFNLPACKHAMAEYMEYFHIVPEKTRLFITHAHSDHCGLAKWMSDMGIEILGGRDDKRRFDHLYPTYHPYFWPLYELEGVSKDLFVRTGQEPDYEFFPYTRVHGGQSLQVGDFCFHIVDMPGHTEGHLCLYEEDKRILISGDHILSNISPNITCLGYGNPLALYLKSLDLVEQMEIDLLLPAHRDCILDLSERVEELRLHHEIRLGEILEHLRNGEQNCNQIARHLSWHISKDLYDMPAMQIFCALGETLAHLEYLYELGVVDRRTEGNTYLYSLRQIRT